MMRPAFFLILALLAACTDSSSPPRSPPHAAGWALLPNSPVGPGTEHHQDISFISADTGWMVDIDGRLSRTNDGGSSWLSANYSPAILMRSVGFLTATHGFVGNLNNFDTPTPLNALFETLNGGTTLTNISSRVTGPAPVGVCGMWVLDATTIFAVGRWSGPAIFLRSTDAGVSWKSVGLAPLATGIVDVYFWDAMHGIVVGGNGVGNSAAEQAASHTVILGTADGGDTWQLRFQSSQPGTWAWKIAFPSDSVGYVAEQGPNPAGFVIKTTDRALTWTEYATGTPGYFSGIGFTTETVGWVGADSATYETDDGALSWHEVRIGSANGGEDINRIRMLSNFIGYAIGLRVYKFDGTLSGRVSPLRRSPRAPSPAR